VELLFRRALVRTRAENAADPATLCIPMAPQQHVAGWPQDVPCAACAAPAMPRAWPRTSWPSSSRWPKADDGARRPRAENGPLAADSRRQGHEGDSRGRAQRGARLRPLLIRGRPSARAGSCSWAATSRTTTCSACTVTPAGRSSSLFGTGAPDTLQDAMNGSLGNEAICHTSVISNNSHHAPTPCALDSYDCTY
jgi:hypothetical protein